MFQIFTHDDLRRIYIVEGLQDDGVAPPDEFFQRSLTLSENNDTQISVLERGLAVHQSKVTVADAGFHAVAFYQQIKITAGVFYAGVFLAVVLFKGERAKTCAHCADNGYGKFTGTICCRNGGGDRGGSTAQQIIGAYFKVSGNARERLWVRGGTPGLPLADSLLRDAQQAGKRRLGEPIQLAQLLSIILYLILLLMVVKVKRIFLLNCKKSC